MKAYKKMLGNTIYRLRKEKGLSQAELGELVGVSNKAVSKWETDEANPDISLIPLLAEALGVTADELLTDIKAESDKQGGKSKEPKPAKVFGMQGTLKNTTEEYEFVSDKKTKKGTPYVHIHIGKTFSTINAKAKGVVAIGNNAKGLISIGLISCGLFSIGLVSIGLVALGIISIGLLAIACFAFGGVALGALAVGIVAVGAVAIGFFSVGAVAIGHFAHTSAEGLAIGKNIFIHKNRR